MARAVGINHVALEVGDLEAALEFYGRLFDLELRGRVPGKAFVDLGDQFLAFSQSTATRTGSGGDGRHFGLVVDDREAVRAALAQQGIDAGEPGGHLRFDDPWGNAVEIVAYADVQFTKAPEVLRGMGAGDLEKSPSALAELREKGLGG